MILITPDECDTANILIIMLLTNSDRLTNNKSKTDIQTLRSCLAIWTYRADQVINCW